MRTTLLAMSLVLVVPTVASAESLLVVTAPTANGLVFGRHAVIEASTGTSSARAQSRTVYLNKNGVTLTPGPNDSRANRSSIIANAASVPAWNPSPALWSQTVTCLREMFAPFDVHITETDPGSLPHIEAVFGGAPANLGFEGRMAGVSPFSSACKVIENSIVFTFTDVIPQNAQVACEIMAQEIAHSYGLDHELLASDPMTYLSYSGKRSFQDQTAPCGEVSARACGLPNMTPCRAEQNSHALLLERIGAAGTGDIDPPSVAIQSPADGATVQPGFAITAAISDDVTVKFATLMIDGEAVASLTTAPWTFTAPSELAPGAHVVEIKATDGANERIATIEITIPGVDGEDDDADSPVAGCATGGRTSWLVGLLLLALIATKRRAHR